MVTHSPHRLHLLLFVAICVPLLAVALADQSPFQSQEAPPIYAVEPRTAELPGWSPLPVESPEALIALSVSVGSGQLPTPQPTPETPRWPEWAMAPREIDLVPLGDPRLDAGPQVPEGSYLKIVAADGSRLRVRYGGDGRDRNSAEGWVNIGDIVPSGAPRWVTTRQIVGLRSSPGSDSQPLAWLSPYTVLEVIEDRGRALRVFCVGDALARGPFDGWVDSLHLEASGVMLAADKRGVRWLRPLDADSLRSGEGVWLKVPYRTQLDGSPSAAANCGPVSVGMSLQFFNRPVATAELRAHADRLQGGWCPDCGVAIEWLAKIVESHGLRTENLYDAREFKRWTLEEVRDQLSRGHPVIPQLRYRLMPGRADARYGDDHYVVLCGVLGDDFIYNDPADVDGLGYARVMDSESLMRAWRGSSFPLVALAVSGLP